MQVISIISFTILYIPNMRETFKRDKKGKCYIYHCLMLLYSYGGGIYGPNFVT